ncbi:hypothetical protein V5799_012975 [Amblyomma americanum]|uniref:Uncharacterized protein n=1 Tax=Amblyomma americanum TaxID=6943 RepID=A0AAQ4E7B7_AMBAM
MPGPGGKQHADQDERHAGIGVDITRNVLVVSIQRTVVLILHDQLRYKRYHVVLLVIPLSATRLPAQRACYAVAPLALDKAEKAEKSVVLLEDPVQDAARPCRLSTNPAAVLTDARLSADLHDVQEPVCRAQGLPHAAAGSLLPEMDHPDDAPGTLSPPCVSVVGEYEEELVHTLLGLVQAASRPQCPVAGPAGGSSAATSPSGFHFKNFKKEAEERASLVVQYEHATIV